jgi:hypothetical protein
MPNAVMCYPTTSIPETARGEIHEQYSTRVPASAAAAAAAAATVAVPAEDDDDDHR